MTDPRTFTTSAPEMVYTINAPKEQSGWCVWLTPDGHVKYFAPVGAVPCWIHRKAQKFVLGIKWRRVDAI